VRKEPRHARHASNFPVDPVFIGLGVLWIGFTAFKLAMAVAGQPWIYPDSKGYEAVGNLPLLSSGFLAGSRPILIPLMWKITGSTTSFLVLQTLFSTLCWGALALSVASKIQHRWRSLLGGVAILTFALSPTIIIWDRVVLSETVSLGFIALLLAEAIWISNRVSAWRLAIVALTLCGFVTVRDEDIWTTLLAAAALLAVALSGWIRTRSWSRPVVASFLVCLVIALSAQAVALDSGRNVLNVEDTLKVRVFPYPSIVDWFAARGMPQAALIKATPLENPATIGRPSSAYFSTVDFTSPRFRQLNQWVHRSGATTYLEWLVLHPVYDLTAPFRMPRLSEYDMGDGSILAYSYQSPAWETGLGNVIYPSWEAVLAMSLLGSMIAFERRMLSLRHIQIALVLIVLGVLSLFITWHAEAYEVVRHMLEGDVEARLGALSLLLFAALCDRPQNEGTCEASLVEVAPEAIEAKQSVAAPSR